MTPTPMTASAIVASVTGVGRSPSQIHAMTAAQSGLIDRMNRADATDVFSMAKT